MCDKQMAGCGAFRVHGGGIPGTIQEFVFTYILDAFKIGIENVYSRDGYLVLFVRIDSGIRVR